MSNYHLITLILTFVIHFVGTLSYAVRIVGVNTKKVALTLSLFNILVLVSRTANTFQAPLVANIIEKDIVAGILTPQEFFFHSIIFSATFGTLIGILCIPTFQRMLGHAVNEFSVSKSMIRVVFKIFDKKFWSVLNKSITIPSAKNLDFSILKGKISFWYVLINLLGTSILTIGVIAAIYAGYLNPDFRTTSSNLSSVINGFATFFMLIFLDPYLSIMVDETVHKKMAENVFRRYMVLLLFSRLFGTILAQFMLYPAAEIISMIAEKL
ncbi:MAG: lipid II flippase Amj family protein [Bacteroidetes bacterium]|nr:lipid II flippase Amj family protein [Bacteroidota bacterium]